MEYEYSNDFKVKYIIYFGLFLIVGFAVGVTIMILTNNSDDYTSITRETEITGQIHNIERNHGTLLFNIDDTLKYKIRAGDMYNYKYAQPSFFFFASGSDWIEKRKGSDTLFIRRPINVRRSEHFIFVLGQQLNKELDKGQ